MKGIADEAKEQIRQPIILSGNLNRYTGEYTSTIMADIKDIESGIRRLEEKFEKTDKKEMK